MTKKVLCNYKSEMFKRCGSTSHPTSGYIKKQVTQEDKMNFVTYVNIRLKCYINLFTLFYIVPKRMGSCNVLANAIKHL